MHLVDANLGCDPRKYASGLLLSLSTMLLFELLHINVLSNIDLIENCGNLGAVVEESQTSGCQRMAEKVHWNQLYGSYLTETTRGWRCQGYQALPVDDKKSSLGSYVVLEFT